MNIQLEMIEKTLVVVLQGEIDHHTCVAMRERIDREYQVKRAKHLVFDFAGVTFMDSSGIGLLMGRCRNVAMAGGNVGIFNVSEKPDKVLRLSGVYKLMQLYGTKEEAIGQLA